MRLQRIASRAGWLVTGAIIGLVLPYDAVAGVLAAVGAIGAYEWMGK